ncbi:hypothetical protein DFH08DRAFT_811426 [Mycena albidolilacea]|uniref:Uncharacterized protein n=1 Tax=Mycena albidolilacea TaxID=1033008 RepID=A0AAD6Z7P5_9AGAR|nr:hypothetical protein DFH08DRAFT_822869 [Mycena albidolilacea]KAJ7342332.1 hypothetical protein DFH08DRAFT_811426 [Mycena albidolilacea]
MYVNPFLKQGAVWDGGAVHGSDDDARAELVHLIESVRCSHLSHPMAVLFAGIFGGWSHQMTQRKSAIQWLGWLHRKVANVLPRCAHLAKARPGTERVSLTSSVQRDLVIIAFFGMYKAPRGTWTEVRLQYSRSDTDATGSRSGRPFHEIGIREVIRKCTTLVRFEVGVRRSAWVDNLKPSLLSLFYQHTLGAELLLLPPLVSLLLPPLELLLLPVLESLLLPALESLLLPPLESLPRVPAEELREEYSLRPCRECVVGGSTG